MPLPYVDPHKKRNSLDKASERVFRTRPGQFVARHIFWHIDPWLYRATRGRYPTIVGGTATAPLVSRGAKSGRRYEHQLAYFHDGPDPIVIASNAGGARHPGWYHNLKAHPECEFGGERFVASEVADPDEYGRLFGLAELVFGGYADYREKTAKVGRRIPVVRLGPRQP
jgi:deazaflavin-dependent oxidoreductase (nitroreductase family)